MNEVALLVSGQTSEAPETPGTLGTGYELFGLGWQPQPTGDYVGRHRLPDA
jgi:hypothetical protein